MPQEMNVLCCYACNMYQGHIVKKLNKWQCKICGEKQSIQVVYFRGSGVDCRHQVQRLNAAKSAKPEKRSYSSPTIDIYGLDCAAEENDEIIDRCQCPKRLKHSNGKWSQCLPSSSSFSSASNENDDHSDESNDKENFGSHENPEFLQYLQKLRCSTQSYSFPGTRSSDFCDVTAGSQAGSSKPRTYPLTEHSRKIYDKYEEYLTNAGETQDSELKTDRSAAATFSSDKKTVSKWDKFLEIPKNGRSFGESRSLPKVPHAIPDANIRNYSSSSDYHDSSSKIGTRGSETHNYSLTERSSKFCKKREDFLDNGEETRDSSSKNDFSDTATSCFDEKLPGKWDGCLKDPKSGQGSTFDIEETANNNLTANNRQSTKCNIFEDYNDDLDLTVDF